MPTTRIPPDFKEFLKSLDARNARFMLIGGYAVNAFGYVRNTVDMDVWIASDPENLRRVLQAISIPAISLEDLKRNKLTSGRKKDLVDLDELNS
jgi:hypothetical protein